MPWSSTLVVKSIFRNSYNIIPSLPWPSLETVEGQHFKLLRNHNVAVYGATLALYKVLANIFTAIPLALSLDHVFLAGPWVLSFPENHFLILALSSGSLESPTSLSPVFLFCFVCLTIFPLSYLLLLSFYIIRAMSRNLFS